jgi:hypothetical protein
MMETGSSASLRKCANHPEVTATSTCSVCGKPICSDCSVPVGNARVCNDTGHKVIAEGWVRIAVTQSEFEADMVSRNLGLQNITAHVFSSRLFKLAIGEDSQDRTNIFVPKSAYERALEVLRSIGFSAEEQISR